MKEMSYIDLINCFWNAHKEKAFRSDEICLYFYLLNLSNQLYWPESFKVRDYLVSKSTGLKLEEIKSARIRLKKRHQIAYNRSHRDDNHTYSIPMTYVSTSETKPLPDKEKAPHKAPFKHPKSAAFKKDNKDKDSFKRKEINKEKKNDYGKDKSNFKQTHRRLNSDPNDKDLFCQ